MAIGSIQSGVDGVWSLKLVGVTRGAPLLRIDSFGFWIHSFTVLHGGQRRSKSSQVKWTVADDAVTVTVTVGMEYSNLARVGGGSGSAVVIDWSDWLIGVMSDLAPAHWIELKIFWDVLCCSFCFGTARVQCVMSASVCLSLASTDIFHFPPNFKWNILYISSKAIHAHLQSNLYGGGTVFHTVLCTRVRYGTRT